jgi:hypothetical protein
MIKVLLLISVVAIGLLLVPGLNFEANAIPITNPINSNQEVFQYLS